MDILMFNPRTLEQLFVNSAKTEERSKMKEQGWEENPMLVHMHNPVLKKDVNIKIQEQKIWEDKGYFANPTMIYHPVDGTRMVSAEDAKKALSKGWYASPAFFPGNDIGKIKTPNVSKEAA